MTREETLPPAKKPRIVAVGITILVVFGVSLGQIFSLQVLEKTHYQSKATLLSQRAQTIPAVRGEIFDRDQTVALATSRPSFVLRLVPGEVPSGGVPDVLARLALVLKLSPGALESLVPVSSYSQFAPILLTDRVDYAVLRGLAERSADFPGVHWDQVPLRTYGSLGTLASILGYVGDITQEELQVLYNSGYDSRSVVGKTGLEKQYDFLLRGKDGTRFQTVDALGRAQAGEGGRENPPVPGKTLVLTIDSTYQTLAEKALGPRIGSVVILRPSTGEVLAMVTSPSFDPNAFYGPDASGAFQTLFADTHYPFLNRAIQATYPPASTFKVIMSAAVLGEGVDPLKQVYSGPEFVLGDRSFKEHDPKGLGWVNLARALALSANIYFYTVGVEDLGIEKIARYAKEFGLGRTTGIDLPGEVAGLVPDPLWKQTSLHAPWVGGDTANTSIGQGYLQVTPLQMANAMAMVSNAGTVYRPHLVKKVIDPVTHDVEEPLPEVLLESKVPASVYQPLQAALRGVITDGTAAAVVTTTAVKIAGKTGTGEDGLKGSSNHSWFVAYAPYDEPDPSKRLVVVVQVERTNTWEWWAPKAANLIFQGIFAHQTYEEALKAMGPRWG